PGVSVAWGLWARSSGMTGHLAETDLTRLARMGVLPMSDADGLRLFGAAEESAESMVLAAALDTHALGTADAGTAVQPMLRGLTKRAAPPRRPATAGAGTGPEPDGAPLARRLAGLGEAERRRVLLRTVREHAAIVLGHGSGTSVPADRGFLDIGFDSLTAVELRNRLNTATGLRLPATLIFEHPDPARLADHLGTELAPSEAAGDEDVALHAELDRLEAILPDPALLPDDGTRAALVARLQDLLSRWSGASDGAGAGDRTPLATPADRAPAPVVEADVAEHLKSAAPDELFSFLDRELGSS
ncbi:phosphopantetheine-binding protein, partial [Streptomyces javensis]|uniref:phosphopantetheine-binding protein n=1 Tax=Streptomyces javensis TaxID=114698 RepID=UPI0033E3C9A3